MKSSREEDPDIIKCEQATNLIMEMMELNGVISPIHFFVSFQSIFAAMISDTRDYKYYQDLMKQITENNSKYWD